ncbi:MAG TPA: hypothetical protein PKD85_00860 [Saprospiraceae bacterium]|nr:hypothetical protein [Saprospiraceae bacterium]
MEKGMDTALAKINESLLLFKEMKLQESLQRYKESFEILTNVVQDVYDNGTNEDISKTIEQMKEYDKLVDVLRANHSKLKKS